ncbi:MAG: hypothetical protein A3E80_01125 [Chlamydiae bacterium RIFCSPHIGHO2_12_FULL_49_9]|nr:MAG: hypothetical protein A3E80_01125 [Chlamydiae bacterium RIFCSPHIGHO2_12_FULL_49_9]
MNILHLEASPGWGGQEIRILRESEGMRARGHTVILAVMKKGKLIEEARKAGFTVYELNFHRCGWIGCLAALFQIMRRHHIELVNTHSSLDAWIGGIAARLSGRFVIRTRHLSTPVKPGINSRILYGMLADFVITTCAKVVPMISKQSGKKKELCQSIPTGVDPSRIRCQNGEAAEFREKLGLDAQDLLVGTACFMRSWKGIGDFLLAADSLKSVPGIKWVIIGGGHAGKYVEEAKRLGLEQLVYFTGHLDNPFPALSALDVFTLLSTAHEGVSQAILQAAYLSKPLIATSTGGLGEVCLDKKTGIRVDPFSPGQVARAVLNLKENPDLRKNLGEKARELVLEKFTLIQTLNQMEEVYKKVLSL